MTEEDRKALTEERKRLQAMMVKRERVGGYSESVAEIKARLAQIDEELNSGG